MDAFISYRRVTGGIYAQKIYDFLTHAPCSMDVFMDTQNLHQYAGEFPTPLRQSIADAENFILILSDLDIPEGEIERSIFIGEITYALELGKRMIVVKCNGFEFPRDLHPSIRCLPMLESLMVAGNFEEDFWTSLLAKMAPGEKRNSALNRLTSVTALESREIVESRFSLAERLHDDVVAVDLCASACRGLLSLAREYLERLLRNGCRVRVIMNHPDSDAARDAYIKKISGGTLGHRKHIIPHTYDDLLEWQSEFPGCFAGRTTDEYLPCAIFIIHTKDPQKDSVKVDYYSFNCVDGNRRCALIRAGDEENFKFYVDQFEWLWEHSAPVEITEE